MCKQLVRRNKDTNREKHRLEAWDYQKTGKFKYKTKLKTLTRTVPKPEGLYALEFSTLNINGTYSNLKKRRWKS